MTEMLSEARDRPPTISRETVQLARAGDPEALASAYFGLQRRVRWAAQQAYGENNFVAEEAAEASLQVVFERGICKEGCNDDSIDAWASTIARNKTRDAQRRLTKRPIVSIDDDICTAAMEDRTASPSAEVQLLGAYSMVADRVMYAFDAAGVSSESRELFLLRHIHNLTYEEIAAIMDIPATRVSVRIHRAKMKMLKHYGTELRDIFENPTKEQDEAL